jgi:hypothetical protein
MNCKGHLCVRIAERVAGATNRNKKRQETILTGHYHIPDLHDDGCAILNEEGEADKRVEFVLVRKNIATWTITPRRHIRISSPDHEVDYFVDNTHILRCGRLKMKAKVNTSQHYRGAEGALTADAWPKTPNEGAVDYIAGSGVPLTWMR